jgi:hypothetical protein
MKLTFLEKDFAIIIPLRFYAIEPSYMAEDMNKAVKAFREGRNTRHATHFLIAPRTCLDRRIITEGKKVKKR